MCYWYPHESHISVRSALRPAVFEIRPLWDKCTDRLQHDLESYKVKSTSNFSPFHSTTSRSRFTYHFKTSALNDPKMILNRTSSNAPHVCVISIYLSPFRDTNHFETSTPNNPHMLLWFPNFKSFHSTPSRFCVTGHLRKVHRMTQNTLDSYEQGQMYPTCITSAPEYH